MSSVSDISSLQSDKFQTLRSSNSQLVQSRDNSMTGNKPPKWHPPWQLCPCKQQHHWLSKQPPVRRLLLVTLEPSRQKQSKHTTSREQQTEYLYTTEWIFGPIQGVILSRKKERKRHATCRHVWERSSFVKFKILSIIFHTVSMGTVRMKLL